MRPFPFVMHSTGAQFYLIVYSNILVWSQVYIVLYKYPLQILCSPIRLQKMQTQHTEIQWKQLTSLFARICQVLRCNMQTFRKSLRSRQNLAEVGIRHFRFQCPLLWRGICLQTYPQIGQLTLGSSSCWSHAFGYRGSYQPKWVTHHANLTVNTLHTNLVINHPSC